MFQMMMFLFIILVIGAFALVSFGMLTLFKYVSRMDAESHRKISFLTIVICCVIMMICTAVIVLN